jgi:hypothetical protein
MRHSIEQQRQEVKRVVEQLWTCADSEARQSLSHTERELWTLLLSLGRALIGLFLARQAARQRDAEYAHGGQRYRLEGHRRDEIGTRFGKVEFVRPVGRRVGWRRAACDRPVDRELGLGGGFSLGVILALGRLCAQMAFANARETFAETYQWAPSPRATLRMVDALGERARPFLDAAPPPEDDGEILVVQADGKGAPMISEAEYERRARPRAAPGATTLRLARRARRRQVPKKRRTSGQKSKNAKVAVVGVLYTLRWTPQGMEGPINKQVFATFESHEALFIQLRAKADKRGYGVKTTLFLGDGSEHLWRLQAQYFPQARGCLDWYHLIEKLWGVAGCLFVAGSSEQKAWVETQADSLRHGWKAAVQNELTRRLAATPKTGPGNKWRRDQIRKTLDYLVEHEARMPYWEFREHDWDIGSGAVEGAVRNLVGMRFDGPGMRWGRNRSERLLQLRCILLNGQWTPFARSISEGETLRLRGRPIPAEPHTAKAAA